MVEMELLTWLFTEKKRAKRTLTRTRNRESAVIKAAFNKVKKDVEAVRIELDRHSEHIEKHNKKLLEHDQRIEQNAQRINSLEELLKNSDSRRVEALEPTSRPTKPAISRLVATNRATGEASTQLDWDVFSRQERRILGVFLENRDLSLSYSDVAKSLAKSPYTIKNQMRQIFVLYV